MRPTSLAAIPSGLIPVPKDTLEEATNAFWNSRNRVDHDNGDVTVTFRKNDYRAMEMLLPLSNVYSRS